MRQNSLLVIFLIAFLDLVGFGMLLPVLPFAARDFGGTAWKLGLLMTTYSLLQFLLSPVWGRISDYWGRRTVILVSLTGTCLSMTLLGLAGTLEWLFIARAMAGVFGATLATAYAYVFDITMVKERAKGFGMISAAFGLGLIFGPAIGGTLSRYGYAMPMFAAATLALLNLIFAAFMLDEDRLTSSMRSANRYKRFDPDTIRLALDNPRTRLACLCLLLITFALSQIECVLALYLWNRFQYDSETTGVLLAVMSLLILWVQIALLGRLYRHFGLVASIVLGSLLASASLGVFIYSPLTIFVVGALTVFAIGQGVLQPTLGTLAAELIPPERRAGTMGVYRSFGSIARIASPPVAGWLFDHISWRTPFIVSMLAMALVTIIVGGKAIFNGRSGGG